MQKGNRMRYFLVYAQNYWGRGTTALEANNNARKNGLKPESERHVYDVDPSTYVDEMGGVCRDVGTDPSVLVGKYPNEAALKKAFKK